jgi:hypothetical protein
VETIEHIVSIMDSTDALTLVGFQVTVDKEQGLFSFRSGNQVRLDTEAKKIIQMCLFSNHFSFGYLMCSTRYNIDCEFDEYPLIQV